MVDLRHAALGISKKYHQKLYSTDFSPLSYYADGLMADS
jgi:hypothetical protein